MHLPSQTTTLLTLLTPLLLNAHLLHPRQEGTSISLIGSARLSAFQSASAAFVAATPKPNSIICPGVIGAAPTPPESAGDDVRLRTDPGAISALEQRQSIKPHESRVGGRRSKRHSGATTTVQGGKGVEAEVTGVAWAS